MIEGVDYFPIVDACRTELIPESPQGTLTSQYARRNGLELLVTDLTSIIVLLFQMVTLQKPRMVIFHFIAE